MEIKLRDVAKRFNKEWVFRKIDLTVDHGSTTAITGPNGSGKSTLLQIISGSYLPIHRRGKLSASGSANKGRRHL
jgi:ABC-type Mn2+/Zn2+ transport system ATPase subunit